MDADQIRSLQPELAALLGRFGCCFKRVPTHGHMETYCLGLMSDVKRKSVEPIALAADTAVRTLQEFLSQFKWDEHQARGILQRMVADRQGEAGGIGVIDGSGHAKQGDKTPGVQRQWCGETGKVDNCVVGVHLLYTDNDAKNPFGCMLASDLFLPESWDSDRERCREAGIPDHVTYQSKYMMAIDQVGEALASGVRFSWVTYDEEFGSVPDFVFALDGLGQRGVGEVRKNFLCFPTRPHCRSLQAAHASKRVDNVCSHSPRFTKQKWRRLTVKQTTRGPAVWEIKTARVHLVDASKEHADVSIPTDRQYWLVVARNPKTKEIKYFVSNAAARVSIEEMMRAAFARWHVEKWFERAKQEAGFGAFEVRRYRGLMRHWLCSTIVMYFLAAQTTRLRGEKSAHHAGAGGRGRQHAGNDRLEPVLAIAV